MHSCMPAYIQESSNEKRKRYEQKKKTNPHKIQTKEEDKLVNNKIVKL